MEQGIACFWGVDIEDGPNKGPWLVSKNEVDQALQFEELVVCQNLE